MTGKTLLLTSQKEMESQWDRWNISLSDTEAGMLSLRVLDLYFMFTSLLGLLHFNGPFFPFCFQNSREPTQVRKLQSGITTQPQGWEGCLVQASRASSPGLHPWHLLPRKKEVEVQCQPQLHCKPLQCFHWGKACFSYHDQWVYIEPLIKRWKNL